MDNLTCLDTTYSSTSKKVKKEKKKKKQKQLKLVEFHYNKSIIEEYINSFEDYHQKERALVMLKDYFPDEVKDNSLSWAYKVITI